MSILDQIKADKLKEIASAKERVPIRVLEDSAYFESPCLSLTEYLLRSDKTGIIAEIKRKSPSKGVINSNFQVEDLSIGYMQAGAAALSVLTDRSYFGGAAEDLKTARRFNLCPILRKDFMLDQYQILEAKAWGADVVLLIAKMLEPQVCKELAESARSLGMETLLEVHSESEVQSHFSDHISMVGVNNRDLDDFSVDWRRSLKIKTAIPDNVTCISESGISEPEVVLELRKQGFAGFLIGEAFMSHSQPEQACARFISQLKSLIGESDAA